MFWFFMCWHNKVNINLVRIYKIIRIFTKSLNFCKKWSIVWLYQKTACQFAPFCSCFVCCFLDWRYGRVPRGGPLSISVWSISVGFLWCSVLSGAVSIVCYHLIMPVLLIILFFHSSRFLGCVDIAAVLVFPIGFCTGGMIYRENVFRWPLRHNRWISVKK